MVNYIDLALFFRASNRIYHWIFYTHLFQIEHGYDNLLVLEGFHECNSNLVTVFDSEEKALNVTTVAKANASVQFTSDGSVTYRGFSMVVYLEELGKCSSWHILERN